MQNHYCQYSCRPTKCYCPVAYPFAYVRLPLRQVLVLVLESDFGRRSWNRFGTILAASRYATVVKAAVEGGQQPSSASESQSGGSSAHQAGKTVGQARLRWRNASDWKQELCQTGSGTRCAVSVCRWFALVRLGTLLEHQHEAVTSKRTTVGTISRASLANTRNKKGRLTVPSDKCDRASSGLRTTQRYGRPFVVQLRNSIHRSKAVVTHAQGEDGWKN